MPALNANSVRQSTELPFETWADDARPADALARSLDQCGVTGPGLTVALDEAMRADFALLLLDAMNTPRREFSGPTLGHLRAMKDTAEVEILRNCAHLNNAAVAAGSAALDVGMAERDIAAAVHAHYKVNGARPEFTIVGFGANSASPITTPATPFLRRTWPSSSIPAAASTATPAP